MQGWPLPECAQRRARLDDPRERSPLTAGGRVGPRRFRQKESESDFAVNEATVVVQLTDPHADGDSGISRRPAGRPDLMVETLVLDETKPYHRFFTPKTIELARQRMDEHGYLR